MHPINRRTNKNLTSLCCLSHPLFPQTSQVKRRRKMRARNSHRRRPGLDPQELWGWGGKHVASFLWRLPVHAFQRRAFHVWIHVFCTFKSSQKMFLQSCNLIEFFCMLLGVQSCTYWIPACCRERRPEFLCPTGYCTEQDAWGLNFSLLHIIYVMFWSLPEHAFHHFSPMVLF